MNSKQLGILVVLAVVLGCAGLVLYRNQSASWKGGSAEMGKKIMGDLPVNDVVRISISQGSNQLNLVRKDGLWRVQERLDYPADYSRIRDFLLKVRDLKAVQSEKVGSSRLAALGLAAPGQGTNSALVVEFKGENEKPIGTLLLGKPHLKRSRQPSPFDGDDPGWPDGRYVKVRDAEMVAVIADPLENIEPNPEAWLNKEFFRVEKIRTLEVDFPVATNSWKLVRETESGEWKLADARPGEQLDSAKASSVSYPLGSPSFNDVLPGAILGGTGTNQPRVVKATTFDHFTYTLQVGQKTNEYYPLTITVAAEIPKDRVMGGDEKAEDKAKLDKEFKDRQQTLTDKLTQEQGFERWTYLVSTWTIDPLLKERSQLLVEEKAASEDGANSVDSAEEGAGLNQGQVSPMAGEPTAGPPRTRDTNSEPATLP